MNLAELSRWEVELKARLAAEQTKAKMVSKDKTAKLKDREALLGELREDLRKSEEALKAAIGEITKGELERERTQAGIKDREALLGEAQEDLRIRTAAIAANGGAPVSGRAWWRRKFPNYASYRTRDGAWVMHTPAVLGRMLHSVGAFEMKAEALLRLAASRRGLRRP